jgi:hypothetical protein
MSPRIPPLEPQLDDLLDAERHAPAPDDALARVWSRMALPTPSHPPQGGTAGTPQSGWPAALVSRWPFALAVAVATLAGGALHAVLRPAPPARVVFVARDVPVGASAVAAPPGVASAASPVHEESVAEPQKVRPAPTRAAPPSHAPSSLSAEHALLDHARTALAAGDGATALGLTDDHARRFARPELAEEREAIAIQALVLTGRYAEARERAARFEVRWPSSMFRSAVKSSLASIP